ncbi:MAG: hypothetical protein RML45_08660 [Acetobacteraceae bacterium]|nr:hypothetical protein [Acetobacteraceae bacterium]
MAHSTRLGFAGLQAYHGRAQHLRSDAERAEAIARAAASVRETLAALAERGLHAKIVSGGGTGAFAHELAAGVWTELQVGSYALMDADYARNLDPSGRPVADFAQALFVLATVISAPAPGRAVLDVGHKGVAIDSGLPLVADIPGVTVTSASDEHFTLAWDPAAVAGPKLGQKLRLIPGHCDPTVDRHDWFVGVRGGRVETVFPVDARGAMR